MLQLTPSHEAAFNACGEALNDLGLVASLGFDNRFGTDRPFMFTAKTGEAFFTGSGATAAESFAAFARKVEEEEAKPKALSGPATKEAALKLIDEYRSADVAREGAVGPVLDEIADRIAALQVKG